MISKIQEQCTRLAGFRVGRSFLFATTACLFAACSGAGGGCGGCSGGCGDSVFKEAPFPTDKAEKTIKNSGNMKVTKEGFELLETTLLSVAKKMAKEQIGGGVEKDIEVCLTKTEQGGNIMCESSPSDPKFQCKKDGVPGCKISLNFDKVEIDPVKDNQGNSKINVSFSVKDLEAKIPSKLLASHCNVSLHGEKEGDLASLKLTIPFTFEPISSSPFGTYVLKAGEIGKDLKNFRIKISGGVGCKFIGWFASAVEGRVVDSLVSGKLPIKKITDKLCKPCETNPECGGGSYTCHNERKVCLKGEECLPRVLGKEAIVDLAGALPLIASPDPRFNLLITLADTAEVTQKPDRSLTLGLRSGFEPIKNAYCAPDAENKRPEVANIAPSEALQSGMNPYTSKPFHIGVTYSKAALDQAFWAAWASGSLCLAVGTHNVSMITSNILGPLFPGLNDITAGTRPVNLSIRMINPPTVNLGTNSVESKSDGKNSITSPLLTLSIKDMDIDFNVNIKGRWTRIATMRLDFELPVALHVESNKLKPMIGDIGEGMKNIRVLNNNLLSKSNEELAESISNILPSLIGGIVGKKLEGALDKSIPLSFQSPFPLTLDLDDNSFGVVDDGKNLGVFVNIGKLGDASMGGFEAPGRTATVELALSNPSITYEALTEEFQQPSLTYDINFHLDNDASTPSAIHDLHRVEYRYRIDDGVWSHYFRTNDGKVRLAPGELMFEGDHSIEFESRFIDNDDSLSKKRWVESVRVDYTAPSIAFDQNVINVHDLISPLDVTLRYRLLDLNKRVLQPWSEWDRLSTLDLETSLRSLTERNVVVEVEADDGHGNYASAKQLLRNDSAPPTDTTSTTTTNTNSNSGQTSGGCSSTGDDGPAGFLLFLLAGLSLLAASRLNDRKKWLAAALGAAAFTSTGCKEQQINTDTGSTTTTNSSACDELECSAKCDESEKLGVCDATKGCVCQEYPPLSDSGLGSFTNIAGNSKGKKAVIAYDTTYGDLLLNVFEGDSLSTEWKFIDGKPESASLAGAKNGYRGGIADKGEDAGKYGSVVVDEEGTVHIAYQGSSSGTPVLKYAQVPESGNPTITILDQTAESGFWNQLKVINGQAVVVYTVADVDGAGEESELRTIQFDTKDLASVATAPHVVIAKSSVKNPCGSQTCGEETTGGRGAVCVISAAGCKKPVYNCDDVCPHGFVCQGGADGSGGSCKKFFKKEPEGYPQYVAAHTLLSGDSLDALHLVYFNGRDGKAYETSFDSTTGAWTTPTEIVDAPSPFAASVKNSNGVHRVVANAYKRELSYIPPTGAQEFVASGRVENLGIPEDFLVGAGVRMIVHNDSPVIFWQDTSTGSIKVAKKDGATFKTEVETVAGPKDHNGFHGYFMNLFYDGSVVWIIEQRIDLRSESPSQKPYLIKYSL